MNYKATKRHRGKVNSCHYVKDTTLNRLQDIWKKNVWKQTGQCTSTES